MGRPSQINPGYFRVGVTGHRLLKSPRQIAMECHRILNDVRGERLHVMVCSALAIGADSLFAEAALDLDIPLEALIPFANYLEDFGTPEDRTCYNRLLVSATSVVHLPYKSRSDQAYRAAGHWMAENCQLLVAIWDGHPAADIGGTADVVTFAVGLGRPIIHIPAERVTDNDV